MKWLLFFHALGAIIWLGGSIYIEGLMAGAARTKDPRTIMRTAQRVIETNKTLFIVGPLLVLVFGTWLTIDLWGFREGFEQIWVSLSLLLTLVGIGLGIFFFVPKGKEFEGLVAERGLEDDEAVALGRRIGSMGHVSTLVIFVVFILMIFQPG